MFLIISEIYLFLFRTHVNLFIIVDTADVCWFARYDLAAFFGFTLFVFWPYGFIWLSLFFFVVNLVLPYG